MTLQELKESDKVFVTAHDLAPILGCEEHALRIWAKQRPDLLGFPVTITGTRTRFPRIPFINYVEGKTTNETES